MKAKMVFGLLFAALMLVLMPATAQASGTYEGLTITGGEMGVDYIYEENSKLLIISGTPMELSGSTNTMGIAINTNVSANLTLNGATIDARTAGGAMHLFGGASLTLTVLGNNTLLSKDDYGGIEVASGKTLVITEASTGTLNVTGGKNGAGIGGGRDASGGTIIIHGGTIKATSEMGAGIGGGDWGSGGNITIYGGAVEAKSTWGGAGIGGGWAGGGGTIDIKGGSVKATGNIVGAGIGGGSDRDGGNITISGGTVDAVSNRYGAGIGGGHMGNGGTVKITGGMVFASSLSGKDIGSGMPYEDQVLSDGSLEISGTAAVFLKNDTCPPPTTSTHTHINVSGHTANASVYGYPVAWSGNFGAYLFLYPITYDLNGGSNSPDNLPYYGPECAGFTLAYPTKTGYTFTGWTGTEITEPSLSVTITPDMMGSRDYTAHWRPNIYTVNYDANGGTGSTDSSSHNYDEESALTVNGFSRTGYTFAGWATSAGDAIQYTDGQNVSNLTTEDGATVTLYAKWTPITYTVLYDANGGTGDTTSSNHTYGEYKTLTNNGFTRTGYTFAGWAMSTGGAVQYSDGRSVRNLTEVDNGTVTLYAIWEPIYYTVRYDANGGSGITSNSAHTYDVPKTLTSNRFRRTGYTFAGWALSADGEVVYSNGESVLNLTTVQYDTITLYAKWRPHTYSIHYDPNGGTGTTAPSSHTYDEAKALTANGFTKVGYTFAGWAASLSGAIQYSNEQSVSNLTADDGGLVTLYAKWTPNDYLVRYDANGGTGSTTSSSHTYDEGKALTPNGFTRTGYTFAGWALSADDAAAYGNGESVSNLTDEPSGTATLYAKWKPHTYTVYYDPNGGTGTTAPSSHTYDVVQTLTPNGFRLPGYTLSGWATSADGESVYQDQQPVINLASEDGAAVTLYAVWAKEATSIPRGTVTADVAVRSGPGASYPSIGVARKGTKYLLIGRSGIWYKVSFDGKVGYILASNFAVSPTTPVDPSELPQTEQGMIVNCSRSVNVRSGPGTKYSILGSAPKGAKYTVIGRSGSWYIVAFGDQTGYISAEYFAVSSAASETVGAAAGQGTIVNCNTSVNVRSGPGTKYSVIGSAPKGAAYKILEKPGAWYKIEYNGVIAYISAKYFSAGNG